MNFGWAIENLKAGNKVTRKGWNGNKVPKIPPFPMYIPEDRIYVNDEIELVYLKMASGEVAVVDICDYDLVKDRSFSLMGAGYPSYTDNTSNPRKTIRLHRLILPDVPDGYVVDHINGNKLDNRRCNLRIISERLNTINRQSDRRSTSQYKGVSFDSSRNKWISSIQADGRTKHLGRFDSEIDAAKAYDRAAYAMYGEYARLNFSDQEEYTPMYLWLMPAATVKAEWCKEPVLKKLAEDNGGEIECLGTIRMFTHDSTGRNAILTGWLASQSDMLAEDWDYACVSPEDEQSSCCCSSGCAVQ